ncbi:MAG: hypothetical protein V5B38_08900 [Candidatus Accumulibacter propinquus]|jgi:hypothetical protein
MPSSREPKSLPAGHPAAAPAAVLFLVFNRPNTTEKVFAAIRAVRPTRLYVAADGPRLGRPDDSFSCAKTREIALGVDWPCQVYTLLRQTNLGCRRSVEEALDWFFSAEEEGIILEDDCLPASSFFSFCAELLPRYRNTPQVFSVSGSNFQDGQLRGNASYYFSKHFHCWGWASWRRAWHAYRNETEPSDVVFASGLAHLADGSKLFPLYWHQIRQLCRSKVVDSWAYRVTLYCLASGGTVDERLHIAPQRNLVVNLGFGDGATNTINDTANPAAVSEELDFPLCHPPLLHRDAAADRHTDKVHFGISWQPYMRRQIAIRFPFLEPVWKRLWNVRR